MFLIFVVKSIDILEHYTCHNEEYRAKLVFLVIDKHFLHWLRLPYHTTC